MLMTDEASRVNRLRRAAKREGNLFRKLRRPFYQWGMETWYVLVDPRTDTVEVLWETLDDAEAYFADE